MAFSAPSEKNPADDQVQPVDNVPYVVAEKPKARGIHPKERLSAYFTIACASATGANLTKFTSAPDVFSVSQSWGWKSSSLRTEEYLEVGEDGMTKSVSPMGKMVSLRATVVVGLV